MPPENTRKLHETNGDVLRHDLAGNPRGHCFGCGEANESGLQLRFYVEDETRVLCRFTLAPRFQGPPGHAHGGIIATLLDEAMSKANRLRGIVAMTRHMAIDYQRPVPLGVELLLEGWSEPGGGRKHRCRAELRDMSDAILAAATGLFIEVPADVLKRYAATAD